MIVTCWSTQIHILSLTWGFSNFVGEMRKLVVVLKEGEYLCMQTEKHETLLYETFSKNSPSWLIFINPRICRTRICLGVRCPTGALQGQSVSDNRLLWFLYNLQSPSSFVIEVLTTTLHFSMDTRHFMWHLTHYLVFTYSRILLPNSTYTRGKKCIGIESLALVRRFGLGKGWISPWPWSLILSLGGVFALWFSKGSTALNTLNTSKHLIDLNTEHKATRLEHLQLACVACAGCAVRGLAGWQRRFFIFLPVLT